MPNTATLTSILPKQAIDLSVTNPQPTSQLALTYMLGTGYREDFKTWSFTQGGGFMSFNLSLPQAIPVDLTMQLCAALVGGVANCPITITVNGTVFVQSYSDHDPNWHPVTYTIPEQLLHAGTNTLVVRLDNSATTQMFMRSFGVDQAVLKPQAIDLSVPNPMATPQLCMPLYQGAGYRPDFKTWSLLVNGGFMKFQLTLSDPVPVTLTLGLCASLVQGKANCPITITINGRPLVQGYSDQDPNFHTKSFDIPENWLVVGGNEIRITLDQTAISQLFINSVGVSGE